MITFYIDSRGYQAEAGMTWAQWIDSSYSDDSDRITYVSEEDGCVYIQFKTGRDIYAIGGALGTDVITAGRNYEIFGPITI